jgi:threonine synthase
MYTCPHTAVALAVIEKLVKKGTIKSHERVVCVSTAHGLKFTEFKVRYHESQLAGIDPKLANPPHYLPPDYGQVIDAIGKHFG